MSMRRHKFSGRQADRQAHLARHFRVPRGELDCLLVPRSIVTCNCNAFELTLLRGTKSGAFFFTDDNAGPYKGARVGASVLKEIESLPNQLLN